MVGFMGVFFHEWLQGVKNLASLPCGLPFFFSFLSRSYTKTRSFTKKMVQMEFDDLSRKIIGCALQVHKILGPGMLESAYEECLAYELTSTGLMIHRQKPIPVIYKDIKLDCGYRLDLLVDQKIIIELKSVELLAPVHEAQILTYMRFAEIRLGLLINFNVTFLKSGIKRYVL